MRKAAGTRYDQNRRQTEEIGRKEAQEITFIDLPLEIVLHIFSFLPPNEVQQNVKLVCQLWKTLSVDDQLWKSLVQRAFRITFSEDVPRQLGVSWLRYYYRLLDMRTDFDTCYHNNAQKILGCQHYQRTNKILAECCQRFFVCRHCHNVQKDHQINRYATKIMFCMECRTVQKKGPACSSSACRGKNKAIYYCSVCNFWDNTPDKHIFHCPDCNVCYLGRGLGVDYYHCMECNMCFDKRYQGSHRHKYSTQKKIKLNQELET
jgi:hypothetical protein